MSYCVLVQCQVERLCTSGQQKVEKIKELYLLESHLDFGSIKVRSKSSLFPVLSAPFLSLPLLLLSSPSFSPCLLFPFPYPCFLPFSPSPSPLSHLLFYSPPFPLPSYLPPFSPTLISFHPPSPLFFSSLPPSPLFLSSLPPSPTNITTKAILAGVGWTISPKTRLSY